MAILTIKKVKGKWELREGTLLYDRFDSLEDAEAYKSKVESEDALFEAIDEALHGFIAQHGTDAVYEAVKTWIQTR